jgi:hypothetical protein
MLEVLDSPILTGIEFSQLKVKLSGQISCLAGGGKCGEIPVHLQAVSGDNNGVHVPVAIVVSKGKSYHFLHNPVFQAFSTCSTF